jgi:hypothetical protein
MRTTNAFVKAWLDIKHSSANHLSALVRARHYKFDYSNYLQLQFFN